MRNVAGVIVLLLWLGTAALGGPWSAEADGPQSGICFDPGPSFNPLGQLAGCMRLEKHSDAMLIDGLAIVDDGYASADTVIEAMVNGRECGRVTTSKERFHFYVLGAGERSGCARDGDTVELRVDGSAATPNFLWHVVPDGFAAYVPVQVGEQHAWYWFEAFGAPRPPNNAVVQARVDDAACGEAPLVVGYQGIPYDALRIAGFSRLIVPSSDLQSGCGMVGSEVSFVVGGVRSVQTYDWLLGVQRIDLHLYGDPSCDLVVNSIDATLLLQFNVGLLNALACDDGPDVNGDGQVTASDATLVLQFDAGLIETLPVG